MNKRIAVFALAVVFALALAGCNSEPEDAGPTAPDHHDVFVQELPDGGSVLCVWTKHYKSGGVSCDWEGADRG